MLVALQSLTRIAGTIPTSLPEDYKPYGNNFWRAFKYYELALKKVTKTPKGKDKIAYETVVDQKWWCDHFSKDTSRYRLRPSASQKAGKPKKQRAPRLAVLPVPPRPVADWPPDIDAPPGSARRPARSLEHLLA
ncbi:hypothetical protein ACQEU6_24540 [Spirillospora sp. CA-108201]